MPSNFLNADSSFPRFSGEESSEEKIETLTSYLYMVLENLRYTLYNLGVDNLNDAELAELGRIITEPVYIQLADAEGNTAALQITAQGLASRISDAEGNISSLQQTSELLSSRISNAEGDISSLVQTADGLTIRVSNAEGDISSLVQTADGLTSRVSNAEGDISVLQQTASDISLSVQDLESGQATMLRITEAGVVVQNQSGESVTIQGSQINAGSIIVGDLPAAVARTSQIPTATSDLDNDSGFAYDDDIPTKLSQLKNDSLFQTETGVVSIIDGTVTADYVSALGITARHILGANIYIYDSTGAVAGYITTTGASSYSGRKVLIGSGACQLDALAGDIYLNSAAGDTGASIQLGAGSGSYSFVKLEGRMQVTSASYGPSLPTGRVAGQVFFLVE